MNDKQYTQEMIKNLNNRLKTKQEALTFDDTPTEGSVNPVTSEGVKAYADASKGTTYTAGENITISENNVISAVDTKYTAGDNITISEDNVISSTTDVSGTNDGTNWTFLTINSNTKAIPQGVKIVDGFSDEWIAIQWGGQNYSGEYIWTDGENVYYSNNYIQKILNKPTLTWLNKTWTGLTQFYGHNVWTDGENIYYSESSNQYILDKVTSTWSSKTWIGLTSFGGRGIWTDGDNIYYSGNSNQYVLDKVTSTWTQKTWTGLSDFNGIYVWTDGENIYYSDGSSNQYVLNKATSTWSRKNWGNRYPVEGYNVWTDGKNIYFSRGTNYKQYVLDKSTSTWNIKTWQAPSGVNPTSISGSNIWTDGENIYYYYIGPHMEIFSLELKHTYKTITVLAKVAETGDYSDLKNKPVVNPVLEGDEEKLTGLEIENVKYKIPEVKIKGDFNNWTQKTWINLNGISGNYIWTDGDNIYYSNDNSEFGPTGNYILDKLTSTWNEKTWTGLTNFKGSSVWTDGENIYYSGGSSSTQKILDKSTSTWSNKIWNGLTNFYISGNNVWTDGNSIYYSDGSTRQKVLDKSTSTWLEKGWNSFNDFSGQNIWTDGDNIYYSSSSTQKVLDKATSTWTNKTWTGLTSFYGYNIWRDGENIYYSNYSEQYVLDKATSTWSAKTWTGSTDFSGSYIWTDGENIYHSYSTRQYQLTFSYTDADVLEKVAETGDYNDLKNKPLTPRDGHLYKYSISINNGNDDIMLTNVPTTVSLQNVLTFSELIEILYIGILGYETTGGFFGFINQKSSSSFTLLANGTSYTFGSGDTLTITTSLEETLL